MAMALRTEHLNWVKKGAGAACLAAAGGSMASWVFIPQHTQLLGLVPFEFVLPSVAFSFFLMGWVFLNQRYSLIFLIVGITGTASVMFLRSYRTENFVEALEGGIHPLFQTSAPAGDAFKRFEDETSLAAVTKVLGQAFEELGYSQDCGLKDMQKLYLPKGQSGGRKEVWFKWAYYPAKHPRPKTGILVASHYILLKAQWMAYKDVPGVTPTTEPIRTHISLGDRNIYCGWSPPYFPQTKEGVLKYFLYSVKREVKDYGPFLKALATREPDPGLRAMAAKWYATEGEG